jgi:hypothetical protein
MKKIISFISAANQLLFFIGLIVIGVMFALSFRTYHPEENKVEIVQGSDQSSDTKRTVYTKEFEHQIKDVFIFKIKAEVIDPNAKNKGRHVVKQSLAFASGYYFNSDQTVNIMFVSEGESGRLLFENDRLIIDVKIINTEQGHRSGFLFDKNLYETVDRDSSGDGFLSEDDERSLYVSDYDGRNLKQVTTGISKLILVGNNKVLIVKGKKQEKQFFVYNVQSGKVQPIDTNLEQSINPGSD